eukprot:CAMPEP_0179837830 /NCGR_PEP_ID=MMETSP0982-20121206/290_1 /TAXON_ID=483367 /ORGANISM="non described non described, Strain CCMP 2436" /LENGTH=1453 /DNA_ID=CAMNT_0021721037 /DNA_START=53 /DNA_END=4416 /DNA_ORIENTATION=+
MLIKQLSAAPSGCQVWSHAVLAAAPSGGRWAYIGTLSVYVYCTLADGAYALEKILYGKDEVIGSICWSPREAGRLAVNVQDHIVVWDLDTGGPPQRIKVDGVYSIGWAAHSPHVLASGTCAIFGSGHKDGQVRLHDLRVGSNELIHSFSNTPTVLRWHRSLPKLAVGAASGQVALILNPGAAKLSGCSVHFQTQTPNKAAVTDLQWDPLSEHYLLCASSDGELLLLDTANQKAPVLFAFQQNEQPKGHTSLSWLPGVPGGFASIGSLLERFSDEAAELLKLDKQSVNACHALCMLLDGSRKGLVAFKSGVVGVYDFEKRYWPFVASAGHTDTVFAARFHPIDRNRFATGSFDGTARLWELGGLGGGSSESLCVGTLYADEVQITIGLNGPIAKALGGAIEIGIALPANAKLGLGVVGYDAKYALYSLSFEPHSGDRLAGGTGSGTLVVWDVASGRGVLGIQPWVEAAASGDGHAYGVDGSGRRQFALKHPDSVCGIVWSPHPPGSKQPADAAGRLVTACADGGIRVFDIVKNLNPMGVSGNSPVVRAIEPPAYRLFGHGARAFSVSWSLLQPHVFISSSDDKTARVWDLSGELQTTDVLPGNDVNLVPHCTAVLRGHLSNVRAVHLSSEVPWLAITGGWDGQIAAWDVRGGGRLLASAWEHAVDVYALVSHPSRPFTFVSTSRDNTVRLWSAEEALAPTIAAAALGDRGERLAPWAVASAAASGLPAFIGAGDGKQGGGWFDEKGQEGAHFAMSALAGNGSTVARQAVASDAPTTATPSLRALAAICEFALAPGGASNLLELVASHLTGADVPPDARHTPFKAQLSNAAAACEALRAEGQASSLSSALHGKAAGARRRALFRQGATRLSLSSTQGAGTRLRRDERAGLVAGQQLRLGRFREWCDAQLLVGNWEGALAVAPAVSRAYWAELLAQRAAEQLGRGEPVEASAPLLLAAGHADVLISELLSRSQFGDAALIAAAAAEGTFPAPAHLEEDSRPPPTPGAPVPVSGTTASASELDVVRRSAAAHLAAGEAVDAACVFLTLLPQAGNVGGVVDAAVGCLLAGHRPELALAVGALLHASPELRAHAAWLVAMRCERHGAWELAAAALAEHGGSASGALLQALCARARLCAPASLADALANVHAHALAPAADQLTLAESAAGRSEHVAAVSHAALAGPAARPRAAALALAALSAGFAQHRLRDSTVLATNNVDPGAAARRASTGSIGLLFDARDACRGLPLDRLPDSDRAPVLALVAYASTFDAAKRGFWPVLPPLYDAAVTSAAAADIVGAGLVPSSAQLCALGEICAQAILDAATTSPRSHARAVIALHRIAARLPGADEHCAAHIEAMIAMAEELAAGNDAGKCPRSHAADPFSVPNDALVVPAGGSLPASGNPQLALVVSNFDGGQRIRGDHVTLDNGTTHLSTGEAIMWAKVHPYSPLGSGRLFNPF